MTREEQVRIAIDKMFPCSNKGRTYEQAIAATGFEAGVRYADEHPDISQLWHNPSEKPEEGEFIVCLYDDDLYTGAYFSIRGGIINAVFGAVWNFADLFAI